MLLLKQMLVLLVIMTIGYLAARKDIVDEITAGKLSDIIVKIANPALVLSGGMNADMEIGQFFRIFLLAFTVFLTLIILSYLLVKCFKVPKEQSGIYRCILIFSNIGFMGFPLVQAMYGEGAVLYASIFLIPFNILIYTFGRYQIKGRECKVDIRQICNTGVLACLIAVMITLSGIKIPTAVKEVAEYLGDLTLPLSMIVIGASFTKMNQRDVTLDRKLNLFLAIKMLLLPVIFVIILKKLGITEPLLGVCMVMVATPAGSMNAMLAQGHLSAYGTATKAVAISSVCAVITMPVVALFL